MDGPAFRPNGTNGPVWCFSVWPSMAVCGRVWECSALLVFKYTLGQLPWLRSSRLRRSTSPCPLPLTGRKVAPAKVQCNVMWKQLANNAMWTGRSGTKKPGMVAGSLVRLLVMPWPKLAGLPLAPSFQFGCLLVNLSLHMTHTEMRHVKYTHTFHKCGSGATRISRPCANGKRARFPLTWCGEPRFHQNLCGPCVAVFANE